MTALGLILLAVIIFMFGWRLIGVTDGRTTAIITGATSLLLGAAVVFQGATVFGTAATAPIGALLLLWAIYGAMVSATSWTETGGRAVALYSLFLSLAMLVFATYFAAHGVIAGTIVTIGVAIPFFLQFVQDIVPIRALSGLVGFLFLVMGVVSGAAGLGIYLNLIA